MGAVFSNRANTEALMLFCMPPVFGAESASLSACSSVSDKTIRYTHPSVSPSSAHFLPAFPENLVKGAEAWSHSAELQPNGQPKCIDRSWTFSPPGAEVNHEFFISQQLQNTLSASGCSCSAHSWNSKVVTHETIFSLSVSWLS